MSSKIGRSLGDSFSRGAHLLTGTNTSHRMSYMKPEGKQSLVTKLTIEQQEFRENIRQADSVFKEMQKDMNQTLKEQKETPPQLKEKFSNLEMDESSKEEIVSQVLEEHGYTQNTPHEKVKKHHHTAQKVNLKVSGEGKETENTAENGVAKSEKKPGRDSLIFKGLFKRESLTDSLLRESASHQKRTTLVDGGSPEKTTNTAQQDAPAQEFAYKAVGKQVAEELKKIETEFKSFNNQYIKDGIGKAIKLFSGNFFTKRVFEALTLEVSRHFKDYKNENSESISQLKKENIEAYNNTVKLCDYIGKGFEKIDDPREYLVFFDTLKQYAEFRDADNWAKDPEQTPENRNKCEECIAVIRKTLTDKKIFTGLKITTIEMDQVAEHFQKSYSEGNDAHNFAPIAGAKQVPFRMKRNAIILLTVAVGTYISYELGKIKDKNLQMQENLKKNSKETVTVKLFFSAAVENTIIRAEAAKIAAENAVSSKDQDVRKKASDDAKQANQAVEKLITLEKECDKALLDYDKLIKESADIQNILDKESGKKLPNRFLELIRETFAVSVKTVEDLEIRLTNLNSKIQEIEKTFSDRNQEVLSNMWKNTPPEQQSEIKNQFLSTLRQMVNGNEAIGNKEKLVTFLNEQMKSNEPTTPSVLLDGFLKSNGY
jgi:hypothetical protein